MRRFPLLLVLLAVGLLAPATSQAATAGVNLAGLPDAAAIDEAAATGAKYVRVFAYDNQVSGGFGTFRNMVSRAKLDGMQVVFVLLSADNGAATDPSAFASFAGNFAAQMERAGGAAAYEVWNEEDETQFWGAAIDAGHYAAILEAAYPAL